MPNVNTDEIQNIVRASAASIVDFRAQVKNFLISSLANFAEDSDLDSIGQSRNLPRLPGETDSSYRIRILNAWEANTGAGDARSIIAVIEALGYTFNSYIQGDTTKGDGSFNLIVRSLGAKYFDGSWDFDGSIYFNTPPANGMTIEIVQGFPVTVEQIELINKSLAPILRASQNTIHFTAIQ